MKIEILALNDILEIAEDSEILLNQYYSNDGVAALLGYEETDEIDNQYGDGTWLKIAVPRGTTFKVLDCYGDRDSREDWQLKLEVIQWGFRLIEKNSVTVRAPVDSLAKIEFSSITRHPEEIEFGECSDEDEDDDDDNLEDDFSHIQ